MSRLSGRRLLAVATTLMLGSGVLAGCAAGGGDDSSEDGKVTLSFLTGDDDQILAPSKAVAAAFEDENPDISIKIETQPGGSEGDNLIKTRLATGEMNDMFLYNSGALLQALDPQQNLTPLTDRPWVADAMPSFLDSTKADDDQFGAPIGTAFGGGIAYNIGVYEDLGLTVPTTWDEFLSNSEKIKQAGITPVMQTYSDTWTSQIVMLADFHNILVQDPEWADEYTNNQAKYGDEPGLSSFEKIADLSDAGLLNEDFASAKLDEGLERVASGEAAQYPMLTLSFGQMVSNYPDSADKVGFFPIPGDDPATNGLTAWMGNAVYIPKTTTGDKLEAAKKFTDFLASPAGCDAQTAVQAPTGPYMVESCTIPDDLPRGILDLLPYFDDEENVSLALEFLSPIKGPALEQITVEVGSGISSAEDGAARYDEDVVKQAQQLGLEGW